ncbi:heme ABC transporter permease [Amnimonas aquatica]|uniref:Heme exporter protein C n=1 Tax=Amnimonas aquatica TaxID=2094561 RepID=A0A2P6ARH6_9GAMM|nr:heme ABC transporter permease [Amnimonas aquatica]PQA37064.1 heme ABC transporter permease [Amnimonas aquatica]
MSWLRRLWAAFESTVSPRHFYELSGRWLPWLAWPAAVLIATGLVWGLAFAPADYQQGNSYRIIFIHVPSASLAMGGYLLLAVCALISLVWRVKTADMVAKAAAPVGALFCLCALFTGSLWGKPTWGTYWVWDARLTSMLILLFLYAGIMALHSAFEDAAQGGKAAAILALVGVVNLPVIKYSVEWWNTLHQGSTFRITERPSMPPEMYLPLLVMFFGLWLLYSAVVLMRSRHEILRRERRARWVRDIVAASQAGDGRRG